MVPPHPGPLIAVSGLHADLGKTILVGFTCAVPTVILAGPVFGRWLAPRLRIQPDQALIDQFTRTSAAAGKSTAAPAGDGSAESSGQPTEDTTTEPGSAGHHAHTPGRNAGTATAGEQASGGAKVPTGWAISAILVPVVLMLLRTLAETTLPAGSGLRAVLAMLGEPAVAMLAGFCYALITLAIARGASGEATRRSLGESLKSIAGIVLIIGGGGAFSEVLKDTGISDAVGSAASSIHLSVLLLAWLVALLLSVTTGSATVGIVSSTGIVAPLASTAGSWQTALIVVAIGAGSIGLNYVNHGGFWLVKESFGMSMGTAAKTHTTVQTLVSVFGLGMAALLWVFV